MKDYVVFTNKMFVARVKMCIEIYAQELGLDTDLKNINIEISHRMSRTLGYFRFARNPYRSVKLRFSHELLDGRYCLEDVDGNISHEVLHYLVFELGHYEEKHGKIFKRYCKIFNCKRNGCSSPMAYSELGLELKEKKVIYPYVFECEDCKQIVKRKTRSKFVIHNKQYTCGICGGGFKKINN